MDPEWGRRVWTMQEGVLAKQLSVLYGSKEITWKDYYKRWNIITDCTRLLKLHTSYDTSSVQHRLHARNMTMEGVQVLDKCVWQQTSPMIYAQLQFLLIMVCFGQLSQCSDSLDRIYSSYGILEYAFDDLPPIDYGQDMVKLCCDFVRSTMASTTRFWPRV
jgi:hypothetical protein